MTLEELREANRAADILDFLDRATATTQYTDGHLRLVARTLGTPAFELHPEEAEAVYEVMRQGAEELLKARGVVL
jgi:hypothetical protein